MNDEKVHTPAAMIEEEKDVRGRCAMLQTDIAYIIYVRYVVKIRTLTGNKLYDTIV